VNATARQLAPLLPAASPAEQAIAQRLLGSLAAAAIPSDLDADGRY
jgi:hypothetical protein